MRSNFNRSITSKLSDLEKKLPLEKFIPSALVVFLLCLFILSIITYSYIGQYKIEIESVNNTNSTLKKIDGLNFHTLELSVARRNFIVIDKEEKYLTEIDSLAVICRGEIFELKKMNSDSQDRLKLLIKMDSLSELNIKMSKVSTDYFVNEKDSLEYQKTATKIIQHNLDRIREICNNLRNSELSSLRTRSNAALRTNEVIQLFIIFMGTFSFLIIGLAIYISMHLIRNKNEAQRMLIESYDELEDKVEKRTSELKKTNEVLEKEILNRQKTEKTLRESEYRFRNMADNVPVLIWTSDVNKVFTYLNKSWLEFTGKTYEEEVENGWDDGIYEKDLVKSVQVYTNAYEKRESFEIEYRRINCNGEYKWLFAKCIPRYEENIFVGYIGCCIDIDVRKKNETYLKIQYEVSKTLAESKTTGEALKGVLKNICGGINWNFGVIWSIDKDNFSVSSNWSDNDNDKYADLYDPFYKLPINKGLPGLVLREKKSKWVTDIGNDKDFIRKDAAKKMGWNSYLGIPISNGKEVIAIIECFNRKNISKNQDLIEVLESVGRQVGNFVERKKTEDKLMDSYADLEIKVKERTNELASTLSRLIVEMEDKEKIQNKIKLFAHAIKDVQESVFITDLENKTIFVNEAFEKSFGYFEGDILGKEIPILKSDFIHLGMRQEIMKETFRNGWNGNISVKTRDNSPFHISLSTSLVTNEEGKAEAIVGVCRDITEIVRSEETINKRNSLLRLLNDIILVTNKSISVRDALQYAINKVCTHNSWEAGHGFMKVGNKMVSTKIWNDNFPEKFILLRNITEDPNFYPEDEIPENLLIEHKTASVLFKYSKPMGKDRIKTILSLGLKTGIWIPILKQNELIGMLEFFTAEEDILDEDISECMNNIGLELGRLYEQIEFIEKIKNSETMLKEAQNIAKLGSWEWDVKKDVIIWSTELYSIYELDEKSFSPTYEGFMKYIHPEDVEYVNNIISNALKTKDKFNFYHRLITPSGKVKISKSQGEVFTNDEGEVVRMFGTGLDITEIREAENKIRTSEEKLRKTNEKLIETQQELIHNEKLAALGRFASGVAHEIRNPLANIMSLSQMILKTELNEKNQKRLKYVLTNSEIANNIIKSLLNFASPAELTFADNNLNEILDNVIESIEARCNARDIFIDKNITDGLPYIYSDKLKLENAFMNFVSNSIDAMPEGGKLTINVREDSVENEIAISIADTGVGIPSENLDKILEPFFTTKDEGIGLGMGLAHQTIKQHFGIFNIQSIEDKGTCIEIKLPIKN